MRARLLLARISELVQLQAPAQVPARSATGSPCLPTPRLAPRPSSARALPPHGDTTTAVPGTGAEAIPPTVPSGSPGASQPPGCLTYRNPAQPEDGGATLLHPLRSSHRQRMYEITETSPRDPLQPISCPEGSGPVAHPRRPSIACAAEALDSNHAGPTKRPRPASAPPGKVATRQSGPSKPLVTPASISLSHPRTVPSLRAKRATSALSSLRTPRSAHKGQPQAADSGAAAHASDAEALAVLREELALVLQLISAFLGSLPGSPLRALCAEATAETALSGQVRLQYRVWELNVGLLLGLQQRCRCAPQAAGAQPAAD